MSDLVKWKVHGPVKTLKSEFATWDRDRQDWQAAEHVTVASFHPDGTISSTDDHNPGGTIAHSRWLRDDAGRTIESHTWMNDGPIDRTVYAYDEGARLIRATHLGPDGTSTEVEVYSYDSDGKKTKVRLLPRNVADSECSASGSCGATTGYSIEGTDSAYGAPGASTMTITYDERNLPTKVSFHDANRHPLSYVILMRDNAGRLISEEFHQGEKSPFQNYLDDKAPPEERERLASLLDAVLGKGFSSTTYRYDARGRLMTREHRIGNLGGDFTTYRYGERDDPVEETTEHRTREASLDDAGNVQYSSDRINVQHSQLEYLYDAQGNWTERIVSIRPESEPHFQRSNIERRMITYYPT
ncbi:MAG: hypothetical protein WCA11_00460 [Terracidiphilus sp.]